ncbi:conserved hypothetical protein [uncultured delta proteobacterium]|uniref:Uncharacterized protein n=1 Tax=uncultured delta proteobacterium TaxID=34034 RepID=A0A212JMG7_9DELT|nr:conserved hypothetical protein [uncultured delta proteobacterium]
MKADKDSKIVIIGMGYLMEYIAPCYQAFLQENCGANLLAVTADSRDLERKRKKFGFPIQLGDNGEALRRLKPDIILFAPPPHVAPAIAEEDLKPYYDELRSKGAPLPDIYAFPPKPLGTWYLNLLGKDVYVANILPNMNTKIGDLDIAGEGYSRLTLPEEQPWPADREERVKRFLAPLGRIIRFAPEQLAVAISSSSSTQILNDFVFAVSDALGRKISHNKIAEAMRASHRVRYTPPVPSTPCDKAAVPPRIYDVLSKALAVYAEGMKAELRDHGLSAELADTLENINIDIKLHTAQLEPREQLEWQTRKHATRGGILERACIEFFRRIEPLVTPCFSKIDEELPGQDWYDALQRETRNMLREVIDHTRHHLSDPPKEVTCTMEHHGVLYGLLAREAIRRCGEAGKKALVDGTVKHATERGKRMRQNALDNGDELARNNYRLYREWPDQGPGKMVPGPTQYSPSYVTSITRCEWVEAWKKHGLLEYGLYFCENMDKNLYRAFNEDFVVEVPTLIPLGHEQCTFDWGFEMTEPMRAEFDRKRAAFGTTFTKDFTFHTGHVLRTVGGEIIAQLGEKGQDAYDAATFEFIKRFGSDYLTAAEKAFPAS